jgi:hypothetical protein
VGLELVFFGQPDVKVSDGHRMATYHFSFLVILLVIRRMRTLGPESATWAAGTSRTARREQAAIGFQMF